MEKYPIEEGAHYNSVKFLFFSGRSIISLILMSISNECVFLIFFLPSNQTFLFNYCVVCHELQLASMEKKNQIKYHEISNSHFNFVNILELVIFLCQRKKICRSQEMSIKKLQCITGFWPKIEDTVGPAV